MPKPKALHHIALAVKDIDKAQEFFEKNLGATVARPKKEMPAEKSVSVFLDIAGTRIELLQSTDPEGPVAKMIERRGEGVHSISFEVDDVAASAKELEANKVTIFGNNPRYTFIHPRDAFGVLFELHSPE